MLFANSREDELELGSNRSTELHVVGITLLIDGARTQLDIVGGSSGLADDVRQRLTELHQIWLEDDPANDLARLASPSRDPISVAAETLLLLALAGNAADQESFSPQLDYATMTVSLAAPLSACTLTSLRSQALALTADLVVADLIDGGAWGACLRLGGVTRAFGIAADGGTWTVPMPTPGGRTQPFHLSNAGLAASTQAAVSRQACRASAFDAERPDLVVWAAVEGELAWQAQTVADEIVGLAEADAVSRLHQGIGSALLYRSDDQVAEVSAQGRSRGHQARTDRV